MMKNGTFGLAGDGLGQQGLAGARRADHQHAARDLAAQLLELGGVAQELDQLGDFLLGLVATGDVTEGHLGLVPVSIFARALPPAPLPCICRIMNSQKPMISRTGRKFSTIDQNEMPVSAGLLDLDLVLDQVVDQVLVAHRRGGAAGAAVAALEPDRALVVAGDVDLADAVGLHVGDELRVDDLCGARANFGEKLWKTTMSTTAMTTQSSRFFARSFIRSCSVVPGGFATLP